MRQVRLGPAAAAALLLAACHEAPRDNPFDPVLTPAVELRVALDDTTGTATLAWSRYAGQQTFSHYLVLRRMAERTRVDTLATLPSAQQTSYVDWSLSPNASYGYRVAVVNAGGYEVPSQEEFIRPLNLPPVQLVEARFDARRAAAELSWTAYRGPRFRAYQVRRRTAAEGSSLQVAEVRDSATTATVDTALEGNTEYFYQVVVQTQRGEQVPSAEVSGRFHAFLTEWPLAVGANPVRLYVEPDDRIAALVASAGQVVLHRFDAEGQLLERQVLLDQPAAGIEPRSVATAVDTSGRRYLSLATSTAAMVLALAPGGAPPQASRYRDVFGDSLATLSAAQAAVQGAIGLEGTRCVFDRVRVYRDRWELFADEFEDADLSDWEYVNGQASVSAGRLRIGSPGGRLAEKSSQAWREFGLEAEVALQAQGQATIAVGDASAFSRFSFTLSQLRQRLELSWTHAPVSGSTQPTERHAYTESFPVQVGLPYRLRLAVAGGQVTAGLVDPLLWSTSREERMRWASLAAVGGNLVLVQGSRPYLLSQEGDAAAQRQLEGQASEVRLWRWESPWGPAPWVGVCVPERNQVFASKTVLTNSGRLYWPFTFPASLGQGSGQEQGYFLFPLSVAAGPDGRVYVLDAGNARIQVFEESGRYLTAWGRRGGAAGQFRFGSGRVPEDFNGSIAVDGRGCIYVADAGNQRIQKFDP